MANTYLDMRKIKQLYRLYTQRLSKRNRYKLYLKDALSLGFSHFYKQLNTGREFQFKCLRKTYFAYLSSTLKGDAKRLSSHATDTVLKKHYIGERIVDKAIKELDMFED